LRLCVGTIFSILLAGILGLGSLAVTSWRSMRVGVESLQVK
jgi:hypothetical protein